MRSAHMAALPAFGLRGRTTTRFWRPQYRMPDEFLATIEAIHAAHVEIAARFAWPAADVRALDNLLFYFRFHWSTIVVRARPAWSVLCRC